jgi:hypothetical protein
LRRGVLSLDACLDKLRYVKYGDEVRASDVLTKLECLKALRDTLKAKVAEVGCPSERVDPLVDQLDSIIAMIRYVRSGDIIQPEDHNYIVDALKKARDILSEIESWCTGLKDQLDKCVAELSECQVALSECLEKIKYGVPIVKSETIVKSVDIAVKPPDAEARQGTLEVKSVEVKPADVRNDISISVSVSVTVS